ncbi:MAG TPA: hypothetical protein VM492_14440 [Sumerlaeia bacterium]|nr:hypothetical protein [Sumerlaeia bacterium]
MTRKPSTETPRDPERHEAPPCPERFTPVLLRLSAIALFFLLLLWQDKRLDRALTSVPWTLSVTTLLTALLIGLFLRRAWGDEGAPAGQEQKEPRTKETRLDRWIGVVAFLAICCLAFRVLHDLSKLYWRSPLSAYHGDMLPLIRNALHDFWRDGVYPYRRHHVGHWQIPLTYPPGHWLCYTPAYFFKMDLRYVSAFCEVAVSLILCFHAWQWRRRIRGFWILVPIVLFIAFSFYCLQPMRVFQRALHIAPYWLIVVLWAWTTKRRCWLTSALFLGWACVARPTFCVSVPFWLVFLWKGRRELPVWRMLLACATTGFLIGFFFFVRDPGAFLVGVVSWYEEGAAYLIRERPELGMMIGWSGPLGAVGLFRYKVAVGAFVVLVLVAISFFRMRTPDDLLAYSSVGMILFLMFSVIPFFYIFYPPLFVLFLVSWPPSPADRCGAKPKWIAQILAPILVSAGLTIIVALNQWLKLGGFDADGYRHGADTRRSADLWLGGWGAARGTPKDGFRLLTESEASVGVPVSSLLWREVEVQLRAETPSAPREALLLVVQINDELAGSAEITSATIAQPHAFPVPRGSLFRGLNEVHLSLRRNRSDRSLGGRSVFPMEGTGVEWVRFKSPRVINPEKDLD